MPWCARPTLTPSSSARSPDAIREMNACTWVSPVRVSIRRARGPAELGAAPASLASVRNVLLVATTRERDERPGTLFNGDRATALDFAELTVSVPPNHKQNEIEWATTPPGDPNVNFVVRDEKYLDGDKAFLQALNAQLALRPPGSRNSARTSALPRLASS